jgi:hypothetical protein
VCVYIYMFTFMRTLTPLVWINHIQRVKYKKGDLQKKKKFNNSISSPVHDCNDVG